MTRKPHTKLLRVVVSNGSLEEDLACGLHERSITVNEVGDFKFPYCGFHASLHVHAIMHQPWAALGRSRCGEIPLIDRSSKAHKMSDSANRLITPQHAQNTSTKKAINEDNVVNRKSLS
ncbi:hypothetical protein CY34DRAFT_19914 [Suillus luteus UH-Slu-Lm8-n1]|uniref:Uncharacterized protein n=1 Tax=Suillus luteus UH-Slu-Lm8-n1 TaxID=930992 RepID=A0A0C9ZQ89_9AGAM|nr:hypothetical protein CY34DRAFT_19914 [Suillus luteus UH-Slu-Lm8-n1]